MGQHDKDLIERLEALIEDGLDYDTAREVFRAREDDDWTRYLVAAQGHPLIEEGVLETDPCAMVSVGDTGAYVQVWLYVDKDDLPA